MGVSVGIELAQRPSELEEVKCLKGLQVEAAFVEVIQMV